MSDRIEELIAAGEVEFHPRKGGEFKLPSIKGRSQMFSILTPEQIGALEISVKPHGSFVAAVWEATMRKALEAQRQQTAWEIVDWLEKYYPRAAIALAGELMSSQIDSSQGIERG